MAATALSQDQVFPKNTDIPPIGHTDPAKFRTSEKAHGGAGTLDYFTLVDGADYDTNLLYIHRGVLNGKSSIGEHIHRAMEEMYFVFDGPSQFTVNGHTAVLPARTMVLCPMGSSHGIYNMSDRPLQWMNVGVSMEKGKSDAVNYGDDLTGAVVESPAPFIWAQLDKSLLLSSATNPHSGKGTIYYRRVWSDDSFKTKWHFVDHCLLPPDTSFGYHQHNTTEEIYYIIEGTGRYTINGKTFDVGPGDALPCRLHDTHGLFNNSKTRSRDRGGIGGSREGYRYVCDRCRRESGRKVRKEASFSLQRSISLLVSDYQVTSSDMRPVRWITLCPAKRSIT